MKSFQGKTALISGASSGIGLSLAKALAARGAAVAIGGTSVDKLAAAKAELDAAGATSMTMRFDVTEEQAWRAAAAQVIAELGPIAFLGLNAGVGGGGGTLESVTSTAWNASWNINVMGVVHGLQACLPAMKASGAEGHVLITSSLAGVSRFPGFGPYGVTKAAVLALGEILNVELNDTAVGVSVLMPGPVRTGFAASSERHSGGTDNPQFWGMVTEYLDKSGLEPDALAEFSLDRIEAGALYIISHSGVRDEVMARGVALAAASEIVLAGAMPVFG
jgi:NADP-dependent 3-hydroxy acid dehydrogenase YdfG